MARRSEVAAAEASHLCEAEIFGEGLPSRAAQGAFLRIPREEEPVWEGFSRFVGFPPFLLGFHLRVAGIGKGDGGCVSVHRLVVGERLDSVQRKLVRPHCFLVSLCRAYMCSHDTLVLPDLYRKIKRRVFDLVCLVTPVDMCVRGSRSS